MADFDSSITAPTAVGDTDLARGLEAVQRGMRLVWRKAKDEPITNEEALENVGDFPDFASLPTPDPTRPLDVATIGSQAYRHNHDGSAWELDPDTAGVVDDATKDAFDLNSAQFNARMRVLYRDPAGNLQAFRPRDSAGITAWRALGADFASKFEAIGKADKPLLTVVRDMVTSVDTDAPSEKAVRTELDLLIPKTDISTDPDFTVEPTKLTDRATIKAANDAQDLVIATKANQTALDQEVTDRGLADATHAGLTGVSFGHFPDASGATVGQIIEIYDDGGVKKYRIADAVTQGEWKGEFDATTTPIDVTNITQGGDWIYVNTDGTFDGVALVAGQFLIAKNGTPDGTTLNDWLVGVGRTDLPPEGTLVELNAGTETALRLWSPKTLHDATDAKYIEVTAAATELEVNKRHRLSGIDVVAPSAPEVNDWFSVYNQIPLVGGNDSIITGGGFRFISTTTVFPQTGVTPGNEAKFVFDGTNWLQIEIGELLISISDADTGSTLQRTYLNKIHSPANTSEFFLPPSPPFGVVRVMLSANSDGSFKISQDAGAAGSTIAFEDGTLHNDLVVPNSGRGQVIRFYGDGLNWNLVRPYIVKAKGAVVWHTAETDVPIIDAKNIYPLGTNLGLVPQPTHIEGGRYWIETGDLATELLEGNAHGYLSNGVVGAGGKWIRETTAASHILDKITIFLRSAGTNAGSNVDITIADADGNVYPASDFLASGTFDQHSGGTAQIVLDRVPFTGRIGLGRNKQGTLELEHIGDLPNGLSAVTIVGNNGGNSNGAISVLYKGTNYNDSWPNKESVETVYWTTVQSAPEATDQASYWEANKEYLVGEVISHTEEDATTPDPNAGELFNWLVTTQIDANEFSTWDGANYAAIQGRLQRFAIGSVAAENVLVRIKTNGQEPEYSTALNKYTDGDTADVSNMPDNTVVQLSVTGGGTLTVDGTPYTFKGTDNAGDNDEVIAFEKVAGVIAPLNNKSSTEGLRGEPVADITELAAIEAKDDELRRVGNDHWVFTAGMVPDTTDIADDLATGAWSKTAIYGTVASNEIGSLKIVSNVKEDGTAKVNADYVAEGLFPVVNGYTLVDGAIDNPKFALMYPTLVSGNDLRWPQNLNGAFVRNLGGNASTMLNYQADGTAVNGLRTFRTYVQSDWNGQSNNDFGKGSGSGVGAANNGTGMSSADPETRPLNFAMQFALVLDSYAKALIVDPDLVPLDDTDAKDGDGVIFKDDGAGGIKLGTNNTKTYGVVASQEIGTLRMVPNLKEDGTAKVNADYVADGGFPVVSGYTLINGAVDNPKFALIYPALVSGNDLAWPENLSGAFVRNLGGAAGSILALQSDATAVNGLHDNGHSHSMSLGHNEGGSGLVGTNDTFWASRNTNTGYAQLDSTDPETRPANFAMQFVLTLDSYTKQLMIDPVLVPIDATGVADGDNVIFKDDGNGGFSLSKGTAAGAPATQVGTPHKTGSTRTYVLQWDGAKMVNTLATEVWTAGTLGASNYRRYMIDHLTQTGRIFGRQQVTSSGDIFWSELAFKNANAYVFAHDLREAQAETASFRINSRTTTSLNYTLHDSAGTGDGGSLTSFELSGEL